MRLRTGVDLDGTKIELLTLDARGGEVFRKRVSAPRTGYEATVRSSRIWSAR